MIDPIRLELIKNALVMVSDNMMVSVLRTSRSTLIKSNMDFSASILDGEGNMVAQGLALPAHLGATMPALQGCLDYFGDDVRPGDILANNDPYAGGSHLNDIFMFKPVYRDGKRICFLGLILHHTDLGGRVAGGQAADSDEIFQEGLRIPPSKIYEAGKPNDTLLRLIEHNTRVPDKVMGDVRAQLAALITGAEEIEKLIDNYGAKELTKYMTALIDYTERLVRNAISELPDGEAEFTEFNDDDGVGNGPITIHVKVTVKGDEITVDFTGTSPQMGGALHTNYWFTASLSYAALRTVLPADTPNNVGFYRPITVIAPEGCWVNPRYPAAVGGRGQGGYRVRTVVTGALTTLYPDRMPACPGGNEFGLSVTGTTTDQKRFLHVEFHNVTGRGGGPDADGQDAGPYWLGNMANTSVEIIEAENPLLIDEYGFLPDTGGPGKYRGALGLVRQYRLLAENAIVQLRADRHIYPCWGIFGGKPGGLSHSYFVRNGEREEAPSKFVRPMKRGETFRAEMAGSGGYGDPMQRDAQAVAEDVRQEKISIAHASTEYGVVVDETFALDNAATTALRKTRAAS
ncbi:MAG: 5-oxoprolinase [Rhodospirillaceae bacterium]|jgi:N-methylhydantoinase B|nr:5-oxoprolinase [Rhodospirillaceae bacterium]|tara:strand:+ start:709 stop:2427 length:1719 start_codon:yes stop_codon:yes gene_type:complete